MFSFVCLRLIKSLFFSYTFWSKNPLKYESYLVQMNWRWQIFVVPLLQKIIFLSQKNDFFCYVNSCRPLKFISFTNQTLQLSLSNGGNIPAARFMKNLIWILPWLISLNFFMRKNLLSVWPICLSMVHFFGSYSTLQEIKALACHFFVFFLTIWEYWFIANFLFHFPSQNCT